MTEPVDEQAIETDEPWECNLCFTIKADSKEDVSRKRDRIVAAARRAGVGSGFSDYEGPRDSV